MRVEATELYYPLCPWCGSERLKFGLNQRDFGAPNIYMLQCEGCNRCSPESLYGFNDAMSLWRDECGEFLDAMSRWNEMSRWKDE